MQIVTLSKDRQADAILGGEFDSGRLCFKTKNDALAFANNSAKRGRRAALEWGMSFTQDYLDGVIDIHVDISTGSDTRIFKLIGGVTPFVDPEFERADHQKVFVADKQRCFTPKGKADDSGMLFVGQFASKSDHIIPAIVRLASPQEVENAWMDVLAVFGDCDFKISSIHPDREIDALRVFPPQGNSGVTHGLVEGVSGIADDAHCLGSQDRRRPERIPKKDDFFRGFSIVLANDFILALGDKVFASQFKINKIFPSSRDCC